MTDNKIVKAYLKNFNSIGSLRKLILLKVKSIILSFIKYELTDK